MRILIVQRSPNHRFLEAFREGFERAGHAAEVLLTEQFAQFLPRVAAFRPDALLSVGLFPELGEAVQGALPLVHYELDKLVNRSLLGRLRPSPSEVVLTTYRDDVPLFEACGYGGVAYLPFCPDVLPSPRRGGEPSWEATFVGSIVREETNDWSWYLDNVRGIVKAVPSAAAEFEGLVAQLEGVLRQQERALEQNRWVIPELLDVLYRGEAVQELGRRYKVDRLRAELLLAKEAAYRQRTLWLARVPSLTVFGPGDWQGVLPGASYGGLVDQHTQSSEVFAHSKINVNIQRIYALGGLSDRVFNVLEAGGFLLADRNAAIEELFRDKEEVALYGSPEELADLTRYYLAHDSERQAIARRGQELVARAHRFEHRVPSIVEAVAAVR